MTLIEIYNKYFLINLLDYENIGIDLEINKVLFCFLIGIIVTTVIYNYQAEANTRLMKKLLRYECFNDESAKTVAELGIDNLITKISLSKNSRIKKLVMRVGSHEMTYEEYTKAIKEKKYKEEKIDFLNAKFYLKEEGINEAKELSEMNNTSALNTVLLCILLTAIFVFIMFLMPSILSAINSFLA